MPIQIADKLIPAFTGSLIDQIDFFSNISGSEISASGKLIGNELEIGGQTFTSDTIGGVQNVSELQNLTGFNDNISKYQLSKFLNYVIEKLENKKFFTPSEKKESMKNNIYSIFTKIPLTKKELQTLWGITKKLNK